MTEGQSPDSLLRALLGGKAPGTRLPSVRGSAARGATPGVLITKDVDPLRYERYLYSARIVLPPDFQKMKSLTLEALRPDLRATLALLAVTLEV